MHVIRCVGVTRCPMGLITPAAAAVLLPRAGVLLAASRCPGPVEGCVPSPHCLAVLRVDSTTLSRASLSFALPFGILMLQGNTPFQMRFSVGASAAAEICCPDIQEGVGFPETLSRWREARRWRHVPCRRLRALGAWLAHLATLCCLLLTASKSVAPRRLPLPCWTAGSGGRFPLVDNRSSVPLGLGEPVSSRTVLMPTENLTGFVSLAFGGGGLWGADSLLDG